MADVIQQQLPIANDSEGSVLPGEAACKSTLAGGVFNATLPEPRNGQQIALQVDSSGRLLVQASIAKPIEGKVSLDESNSGVIHVYGTATIESGKSGAISHTVSAGKTFYLKGVQVSSSIGPCKVQVQSQMGGQQPATHATMFYTMFCPSAKISFPQPISFPAGAKVSVIINNNADLTQDAYAFINGKEC